MVDTTKRRQLEVALERAGRQMANILFNLAQRAGSTITAHDTEVMGSVRREWDLAFGNLSQAVKLGATPASTDAGERERALEDAALKLSKEWQSITPEHAAAIVRSLKAPPPVPAQQEWAKHGFAERRRFEERG